MKVMSDTIPPEGKLVVGVDAEWATLPPGAGQQARQQPPRIAVNVVQFAWESLEGELFIHVIQLSLIIGKCAKGRLPDPLVLLLRRSDIVKVGVGVAGDLTRIANAIAHAEMWNVDEADEDPVAVAPALQHHGAKSKQPLFNKAAHEAAKRCLEAIRKGQVSDPVGIELYTDLGPCGGPDGKADDGVRLYSCQRGTNSLEGGIHRNLRQRFPKSGVSPCHANACLADYMLVHNLTVSPTSPSRFEEAATFLTHYPLHSQDLWLTVELHRLRRKTLAFLPRHSTTVSDIVNPLLYTPSTETFGIVPVQSPTAQMRFLIEPYHVERGTLRLEPVKWSPRNLLQNNTSTIQHMQSRLPTDRKLRHDWLVKCQGTQFTVLHVHTPSEQALYIPRWSSLANAQATMNMGGNDVIVIQASLTNPSRGRDVSMLAAKPLLGHKPPVLGRLTEIEVDASDPPTSSIRPFVATASSADLGTSSALTRAGTTKGARHCQFCGQTTCRRKGSKLSDDGSTRWIRTTHNHEGKDYGGQQDRIERGREAIQRNSAPGWWGGRVGWAGRRQSTESDQGVYSIGRLAANQVGLTRAEINGRPRHQKKCHNFVAS
ncbi:BQ5605_C006g03827 [Microbotryum silenes-dioicae]|uniref:BQ5605_C006g03827 protein n=1 Tax=Microbotryum silenes-dioicae TaxID=796604 RepID=A0A2X0P1A7_9BASI|nr:BQ5605_C006g03827 [Microbotryum silenes-dioicae]